MDLNTITKLGLVPLKMAQNMLFQIESNDKEMRVLACLSKIYKMSLNETKLKSNMLR